MKRDVLVMEYALFLVAVSLIDPGYAAAPTVSPVNGSFQVAVSPNSFTLFFSVTPSVPPENISWFLGASLDITNNPAISDDRLSITFSPVIPANEGIYRLEATNADGTGSGTARIDVESEPGFLILPEDQKIHERENVTFQCFASADPTPDVNWFFKDQRIDSTDGNKYFIGPFGSINYGSLTIFDLEFADAGDYTCVFNNTHSSISAVVTLEVQVFPVITMQPESSNKTAGGVDSISCTARGFPFTSIYWQKNGQNISDIQGSEIAIYSQSASSPNTNELTVVGTLTITGPVLSTGGNFSCIASNFLVTFEKAVSNEVEISVQYPPSTEAVSMVIVNQSDPATFNCSSFGIPPPTLAWYSSLNPETPILSVAGGISVEFSSFINGSDLQIQSSTLSIISTNRTLHEANYTCLAVNGIENLINTPEQAITELLVQVPPSLRSPLGGSILGIVTNTITLSLVVDNASPPVRPSNIIWWFKPFSSNTSLTIETGSQYSFSQDRLSLTITYLTHDNEGFYVVMATNEAGSDNIQLTLNIEAAPNITIFPMDTNVLMNYNTSLTCGATSEPPHTVQWLKEGVLLMDVAEKFSIIQVEGELERESISTLNILYAQMNDTADYTCIVSNVHGEQNHTAHLEVQVPPMIINDRDNTTNTIIGIVEESTVISCLFFGSPVPDIVWFKDSQPLNLSNPSLSVISGEEGFTRNSTLVFSNLSFSDDGTYMCQGRNMLVNLQTTDSSDIILVINQPPQEISITGLNEVNETQTANITCVFLSRPTPSITWSRGFLIVDDSKYNIITQNEIQSDNISVLTTSLLQITNVNGDDSAQYNCIATNKARGPSTPDETANSFKMILVQTSPVVRRVSEEVEIGVKGRNITLTIDISGAIPIVNRERDAIWYFRRNDGQSEQQIMTDSRHSFSLNREQLTITNLILEDQGTYSLNASNIIGRDSDTIFLDVQRSPTITNNSGVVSQVLGRNALFECIAVSEPIHISRWLFGDTELSNSEKYLIQGNGTISSNLTVFNVTLADEGNYTCRVDNAHGVDEESAQLQVQVPPNIFMEPENYTVLVTRTASLTCCANGIPTPIISWFNESQRIQNSSKAMISQTGQCGTITITDAVLSDAVQYICEANNTLAEELSKLSDPASVTVEYPPEVFPLTQSNYTRNESDEFIVECHAFGVPLPSIYWVPGPLQTTGADPANQLLSSTDVQTYLSSVVNFNGSRLLNAKSQCSTGSGSGEKHPPNSDICVYETDASNDCSLKGSLCSVPCGVEITSRGDVDNLGRSIVVSRLRICSVMKSDELSYTCVAINNISNVISTAEGASANLIVQVPPEVVSIEEVDPVTAFRDRNVTLNFAINKASPEVDPADIIWTFQQQRSNETVTLDADNPHYQFSSDRRSLRIVDLSTDDTGAYTLIARNPAGIKSGIIDLDVQALPDIERFSDPMDVINNSTVMLECFADGSPIQDVFWTLTNVSGVEVYSIRYVIDDPTNRIGHIEYLPKVDGISVDLLNKTFSIAPPDKSMKYGELTIKEITPFEAGIYNCTLENKFGVESRTVGVQVQLEPTITQPPVDTTCVEGTSCQLTCLVEGVPSPNISFWKNNYLVEEETGIELMTTVNNYTHRGVTLKFTSIRLSDVGNYSCHADNDLVKPARDQSDNITLTIHSPASVKTTLNDTVGNESFGAFFECSVSGIPQPNITWSRIESGQEIQLNSDLDKFSISSPEVSIGDFGLITVNSNLTISDLNVSDELTYSCRGENGVYNAIEAVSVSSANLTVQVPPTVTPAGDRSRENGTQTVIAFNINRARPAVELKNIVWTFQHIGSESGMVLEPSCTMQNANCSDSRYSRYNFSSDLQTLTIYSVRVADYGMFTLTASNPAGRSTETMSMNITVPPKLLSVSGTRIQLNESDTLLLNCTADGLPRPSFTWIFRSASVSIGLRSRTTEDRIPKSAFRASINTVPGDHGFTSILNITGVLKASDEGVYSCSAGNGIEPRAQLIQNYIVNIREVLENFCASNPCENGGTCDNTRTGFLCECGIIDGIRYGGPTCSIPVIVPVPPTITEQPQNKLVDLSDRVELNCRAEGQPTPTIRWRKENRLLDDVGSPFIITEVTLEDRGFYSCVAMNTEGSVTSREALVNIQNVAQYTANLIVLFNQIFSTNLTEATNGIIENINILASGATASGNTFFAISRQGPSINNTRNITVPIIVTILLESGVADETLRENVERAVSGFGFALQISSQTQEGVTRFNLCPPESTVLPSPNGDRELDIILLWNEAQIGESLTIDCPCNLTLGSTVLRATRTCGGNFQTGARWDNPMDSNCDFSVIARRLCRLANLDDDGDILRSLRVVTSDTIALGFTELTITTSLLERTQLGASRNNTLIDTAADTFDNTLQANRSSQQEGQINSRSQARALNVFMNLTSSLNVSEDGQEMIIRDTFATLADRVMPGSSNIDTSTFSPNNILPVNIRADLSELFRDGMPLARTVTAFQNDGLYLERNPGQRMPVTPIVDFTVVNMEVVNLTNTINSTFTMNNNTIVGDNGVLICVFWDETADNGFGAWSSEGVQLFVNKTSGQITCRSNHLTSFSVLLDVQADQTPPPEEDLAFTTLTYIGICVSIVCISVTIFTYLYSQKLRKSEANQLLLNLCFALLGLYLTFFVASQGSKITTVVCGLVGALLHYFLLVVFFVMAAEAIDLFIKLVIVLGSKIQHYITKTAIIAWILPLFIIPFTISPKYSAYVHSHFCGATGPALYVGVLVPFFVVYIFNNTIFFIIMFSLIKKSGAKRFKDAKKKSIKQETKQHCRVAFTVSILFGLGWGFGVLASQAISVQGVRVIFNTLFTIFIGFQGFFIFLLYILMSPNARKEWKRWVLRKEDKGKGEQTSSAASSSRSTASTGVKKYSAASYSMYNKKRGGTLYHNVYSKTSSSTSGYTEEFASGVFDSEQPMLEEMKLELGDQILPNPLEDYEDTFSMLSEPDAQSIGETTYAAFPNPKPPLSLEEGVEVDVSQPLEEDVPVECTTLDNPFLVATGKQISVDGEDIELLSQDTSTGNRVFSFDMSEPFSQSQGLSDATFADDKNLIRSPGISNY